MRARLIAAVVATGAVSAAAVPLVAGAADAAPAGARQITVVQHNTDKHRDSMNRAIRKATDAHADAITLQEICEDWVPALRQAHPSWTIATRATKPIAPDQTTAPCAKGSDVLAVAIWTGGKDGRRQAFDLEPDGGFTNEKGKWVPPRTPALVCVSFGSKPVQHVCSTHLVAFENPQKPVRAIQTRQVADITAKWRKKGHSVVVGGDFNSKPMMGEMDSMYAYGPGAHGAFTESDQLDGKSTAQAGRSTSKTRGKIDYLFFSRNRTPLQNGGTLNIVRKKVASGHDILVARTTVSKG
ncbi:endonuclease/exonuclease/phosphatase family protein [Luteipulveratus sp. YIM 133132]|uniref:endonuclease/exonuclease/phosphatase family protein n=1 Tax=Luteipulveratus flavus TaxID=3031728 RepID=UPI0023AE8937|nr:endonuclease/exonuclease/phosphatase family protein [Luteipulveratus sp. YIM 133132]MDE9364999.1 endonuclease/exonuclease/phosphatase family protein [Luteipulveratus sp. YIM 133132]